ncbi:hypothetical protein [Demequina sp.]|uniref:hypothetical protein n=1 Tax=Demequina sp. TaxID=2050685 RepID=UPI003A88FC41
MDQNTAESPLATEADYAARATDARDRAALEWDNLNIHAGLEWDQRARWGALCAECLFFERLNAERWLAKRFPALAAGGVE